MSAIDHPCPHCEAKPGDKCTTTPRSHPEREALAVEVAGVTGHYTILLHRGRGADGQANPNLPLGWHWSFVCPDRVYAEPGGWVDSLATLTEAIERSIDEYEDGKTAERSRKDGP